MQTLRKLVFVAGGVGVNPLISIVSHIAEKSDPRYSTEFLYSVRDPGEEKRDASNIHFLDRLSGIFNDGEDNGNLRLFLTPGGRSGDGDGSGNAVGGNDGTVTGLHLDFKRRRISVDDISSAIGKDRESAVVYICGVPSMTDELVEKLNSAEGLGIERHRILYEKWW